MRGRQQHDRYVKRFAFRFERMFPVITGAVGVCVLGQFCDTTTTSRSAI
jgi:hypothetical protein